MTTVLRRHPCLAAPAAICLGRKLNGVDSKLAECFYCLSVIVRYGDDVLCAEPTGTCSRADVCLGAVGITRLFFVAFVPRGARAAERPSDGTVSRPVACVLAVNGVASPRSLDWTTSR